MEIKVKVSIDATGLSFNRDLFLSKLEPIGSLFVESIKHVLGTSEVYTLTPEYSALKVAGKTRPPMKRYGGKAVDQPLILTGAMYDAVECHREGNILTIGINDSAGFVNGFDYAQFWEEKTGYLEKALEAVTHEQIMAIVDSAIESMVQL